MSNEYKRPTPADIIAAAAAASELVGMIQRAGAEVHHVSTEARTEQGRALVTVSFSAVPAWDSRDRLSGYRAAKKVMRTLGGKAGPWYGDESKEGTSGQRNVVGSLNGVTVSWIETRHLWRSARIKRAV